MKNMDWFLWIVPVRLFQTNCFIRFGQLDLKIIRKSTSPAYLIGTAGNQRIPPNLGSAHKLCGITHQDFYKIYKQFCLSGFYVSILFKANRTVRWTKHKLRGKFILPQQDTATSYKIVADKLILVEWLQYRGTQSRYDGQMAISDRRKQGRLPVQVRQV